MNGKLVRKTLSGGFNLYTLYTDSELSAFAKDGHGHGYYKMNKNTCDAFFGVIDIDVICKQARNQFDGLINNFTIAFAKECVNIVIELNKDKQFTIDDIRKAVYEGVKIGRGTPFVLPATDDYLNSIQQPTEINVNIDTHLSDTNICTGIPKLDKDGYIIMSIENNEN